MCLTGNGEDMLIWGLFIALSRIKLLTKDEVYCPMNTTEKYKDNGINSQYQL